MKNFILTLLVCLIALDVYSNNRPKDIPDRLSEVQAKGWYDEMARSWKLYLEENPEDKEGWLQYFKSSEYAGVSSDQLLSIGIEISNRFEGTTEASYVKFKILGWNAEGIEQLKLAIQQKGNSKSYIADQIMLAEVSEKAQERQQLSKLLFLNKSVTPSLLNYSYNVLMSVGDGGVLFVQGEASTIPIWILQDVMQVRRDVKVLNLDLAINEPFLASWLRMNNVIRSDIWSMELEESLMMLPELNPETDFYYALTLPNAQINFIEDRLYVVGLASLHRNDSFDHYRMIKENVENKFLIDYLTVDFNGEPKTATGRVYESNYILPLMLLKEYYDNLGDTNSSNKWREVILTIADRSQIKNRVALLMNDSHSEPQTFIPIEMDVKGLDNNMKKIRDNLYASEFEVTNMEYWFYLDYLRENGHTNLYNEAIVDLGKYDELTASFFKNYHYSPTNYQAFRNNPKAFNNRSNFMKHPALDMTYDAARTYCEWLTFQYNNQPDREFNKVQFRLPSQKEWSIAALGWVDFTSWILEENIIEAWDNYDERKGTKKNKNLIKKYPLSEREVLYPWWWPNIELADKILNFKNCYLANVKTPEEIICAGGHKGDGFTLMSPVGAYFANRMGFYDVIGNVAEMIDEEGKAMGGSWNHEPEESTIKSVNIYDVSDPSVGFRLFMEVIEE